MEKRINSNGDSPGKPGDHGSHADASRPDSIAPSERVALDPAIPVDKALCRAFTAVSLFALEKAGEGRQSVREFRKSIQRLRSLVRVARSALGEEAYRSLNRDLRSYGRGLSELRDAQIILGALESVPESEETREVRAWLRTRLQAQVSAVVEQDAGTLSAIAGSLTLLPDRFEAALTESFSLQETVIALEQTFCSCRESFCAVLREGKGERIHDFRKKLKTLRFQAEFLSALGGRGFRRRQRQLRALARALGDVTDLLVLRSFLKQLERSGNGNLETEMLPDLARFRKQVNGCVRVRFADAILCHGVGLSSAPPIQLEPGGRQPNGV